MELQQGSIEKQYEAQGLADRDFHEKQETEMVGFKWKVEACCLKKIFFFVCRLKLQRKSAKKQRMLVLALS